MSIITHQQAAAAPGPQVPAGHLAPVIPIAPYRRRREQAAVLDEELRRRGLLPGPRRRPR